MKLSIIIPVRNEKFLIKKIVDQLQSKLKILSYEIIFIDDFSTDNTTEVIKELIKTKPQIKIYNNKIKGLGGAITKGINDATGEVICIMMSDLSDSINDLDKYYNIIKDEDVDAVFESKNKKKKKVID
jgi:glycosyltransferase involved in cell wall biosynthesis